MKSQGNFEKDIALRDVGSIRENSIDFDIKKKTFSRKTEGLRMLRK